jgi:hypothetical protein
MVRAVFYGSPLRVSHEGERSLSNLPHTLRPTRGSFRVLAKVPGVLFGQRSSTALLWCLPCQNAMGYASRLRPFHGAHEGDFSGLCSSWNGGVAWWRHVFVGFPGRTVLPSPDGNCCPGAHSARVHDSNGRRLFQFDSEQADCKVPMMLNI